MSSKPETNERHAEGEARRKPTALEDIKRLIERVRSDNRERYESARGRKEQGFHPLRWLGLRVG